MADLTHLNFTDSLESFLSHFVFALFQAISIQKTYVAWLSSLQTLLTNLNFHIGIRQGNERIQQWTNNNGATGILDC